MKSCGNRVGPARAASRQSHRRRRGEHHVERARDCRRAVRHVRAPTIGCTNGERCRVHAIATRDDVVPSSSATASTAPPRRREARAPRVSSGHATTSAAARRGPPSAGELPRQHAARERRPRGNGHAVRLGQRQRARADVALHQAVRHLQPDERRPAPPLREHPGPARSTHTGRIRHADVEHLAGAHHVVERAHRLVDRGVAVVQVQPVDVDVVGAQPPQARLE